MKTKQLKRKTLSLALARAFAVSVVAVSMISLPVGALAATIGSSSNASNPGIILSSGTTTVNGSSDVWEPNPQAQNGAVQFNGGNLAFDYMGQTNPNTTGTVKQANGATYSTTPPLGMMPVGPYVYIPMDTVTMYQSGALSTEDGAAYDDVFQFTGSNPVTNAFGTLTMDNTTYGQTGAGQMSADFVGTQPLAADGLIMDGGMNLIFGDGSTPTSETLFDIQANNQPNFWIDDATVSTLDTSAVADSANSPGLQFFMENGAKYVTGSLNITPGGTGYNTDAMVAGTGTFAAADVNLSGSGGDLAFEGDNNYLSTLPATGKLTAYLSQGSLGSLYAEDATVYLENNGGSNGFTGNVGFGANATMYASGAIQGSMQLANASDSLYIANTNLESQYDTGINTFNGLILSGSYVQSAGSLYIPISPTKAWGLTTGGNYAITGGNVIVSGETGTYANGAKYTLIQSTSGAGSNAFAPKAVYYVYNGTVGSQIDGLSPYLKKTSTQVDLCLGSACLPAQPAPSQPAKSTPSSPAQPAKSQPAQPVQPIAPVAPVIPVQVVTPVQEANPVLADSAGVTQASIQDTAQSLVSTGVVGGGPRGVWLKTLGGFSSQDGYAGTNYGLLAGYGKSVGPDGRDVAGVAFSAGQAGLGTGLSDFTRASDYGLWAYGTYYPYASRTWKITGTIGGGLSTNTLESMALGLPQTAHFQGGFLGTEIRASYWKTLPMLDNIIVSPRLSVGYDQSWTGGFATHGGGPLDVQVSGQSDGQLYLSPAILVGKKFDYRSQSGRHTIFPQLRLGAVENVGPNPAAEISSGQVAGQVQGLAYPHLQGMAEVRLDVISHTRYSKGLSVNISARELFGGGASSMEGVAAIKYHW